MQFKKDLLKVFSSNFINVIVGIITGFILPVFLSIEQYGYLKTFTLYLSFVGILHFGYIDGIYIKYGGKLENELDKRKLLGENKILILFQLIVTLISAIVGIYFHDLILIAFSFAILPINFQTLFKFLYQALGEFSIYSKIVILTPILLLVINIFLVFIVRAENFWPYVIGNIVTNYIVFFGLEIYFINKNKGNLPVVDFKDILNHFKVGFFIMLGNLSSMLFYALDRWIVKFTLPISDFAFYSFAISMVGVITILISSVTMTFYPYLARGQEIDKIKVIKRYLLIIGVLSTGCYFIFKFIVNLLLKKYIPSLDIISLLFAGYPAIIVINALYINLYKANKQEKKYVKTVALMLSISVLANTVAILINKSTISVALATTISFYIWYLYSAKHFSFLKHNTKEIIYLLIFFVTFYLCSTYFNWIIGLVIYYIIISLLTYFTYKQEAFLLVKEIINR